MWHKWIHYNALHVFDFRTAKWTAVTTGLLPLFQAQVTHQMATGFQPHIFIILGTNLAKLKSGAHLTVELILLLCYSNMLVRGSDQMLANIRIGRFSIWVQVAGQR